MVGGKALSPVLQYKWANRGFSRNMLVDALGDMYGTDAGLHKLITCRKKIPFDIYGELTSSLGILQDLLRVSSLAKSL